MDNLDAGVTGLTPRAVKIRLKRGSGMWEVLKTSSENERYIGRRSLRTRPVGSRLGSRAIRMPIGHTRASRVLVCSSGSSRAHVTRGRRKTCHRTVTHRARCACRGMRDAVCGTPLGHHIAHTTRLSVSALTGDLPSLSVRIALFALTSYALSFTVRPPPFY